MKKYRAVLSLLVVLCLVSLILPNNAPPAILLHSERRPVWLLDSEDVWLEIDQNTVTATGLDYSVQCLSGTTVATGYPYAIVQEQKWNRSVWTEVPYIEGSYLEFFKSLFVLGWLPPGEDPPEPGRVLYCPFSEDWAHGYGSLPPGRYYLVKEVEIQDVASGYLAAEFTIPA